MTYSKTQGFSPADQELAQVARALSHPARVAIIRLLANRKTCISGDISRELPLSRTTVSQHLQELKKLGIIRGEVDGLHVCYCLDLELLGGMTEKFLALFAEVTQDSGTGC
jgi:DNA-binding transcriptional ArsR family regulator